MTQSKMITLTIDLMETPLDLISLFTVCAQLMAEGVCLVSPGSGLVHGAQQKVR